MKKLKLFFPILFFPSLIFPTFLIGCGTSKNNPEPVKPTPPEGGPETVYLPPNLPAGKIIKMVHSKGPGELIKNNDKLVNLGDKYGKSTFTGDLNSDFENICRLFFRMGPADNEREVASKIGNGFIKNSDEKYKKLEFSSSGFNRWYPGLEPGLGRGDGYEIYFNLYTFEEETDIKQEYKLVFNKEIVTYPFRGLILDFIDGEK